MDTKPERESKEGKERGLLSALIMDYRPLRASRDYRLLYIGQFISNFGMAIGFVVLPWQMYRLTGSTLAVGMLGVVEFVPMLLIGLLGGALADYVDRRRIILLAETGLMLCCLALSVNSLLAHPRPWVLFVTSGIVAALNALHRPAMEALVPRLVDPEHLPAVAALASFRFSFTFIIGPSIAGIIAASLGATPAFLMNAAAYGLSIVTILMIQPVSVPKDADRPGLSSIIDGLRYARSRKELLGTYLIDLNAMFFGMPMALFPAIADSFGGASLGLLYAMPAVGSLLVSLTSGWSARIHRHGVAITVAAAAWGAAIIGFGLATRLSLALLCLALAGGADMISGLFRMTMWNQTIPDRLRGRLAGIELISYTTGPYLGNGEAGIVANFFGIRASVVSGGMMCVLGSGLLALLLPTFLKYDGRAGLARKLAEEAESDSSLGPSDGELSLGPSAADAV